MNRPAIPAQWVLLLGLVVQICGLAWDLKYHETLVGPEPFWVAPHIVVVVGLAIVVMAAMAGSYVILLRPHRWAAS